MLKKLLDLSEKHGLATVVWTAILTVGICGVVNILNTGTFLPHTLLVMLEGSICLNIVFLAWILVLYLQRRLKLRFGVYWDREKHAYCPLCGELLQIHIEGPKPEKPAYFPGKYVSLDDCFYCRSCREYFEPCNKYGKKVSLDYAIDNCR